MTAMRGSVTPMAITAEPRVRRFSATERIAHWVHAVAFFAMLGTGLVLYLPALAGAVGSREAVKSVHLYVAGSWVAALLLVCALGDRRALRASVRELERFDADDGRWLRGRGAPQARFNAGQKVHAVVQAAFAVLFGVSGTLLFLGERDTRFRLDGTILLHDGLTVVATLLVAGHLYLALVHPPTRPSLRGIVLGTVDENWARAHHAKWTAAVPTAAPSTAALRRPASWLLLLAATVAVIVTLSFAPSSANQAAPRPAAGLGR
jgi:formate dehydrogenase subunit gamma